MLEHGGRLRKAAQTYGRPLAEWLDLSTGITPFPWPLVAVPASAWQRLPEDEDGLLAVASAYYGAPGLWPVAGSQAAIQVLPRLRPRSRIGVITPGYAEHAHAWREAGHQVECAEACHLVQNLDALDVLVLIHPNNPGGDRFSVDQLLDWHARLAARGGWLIVDEAFIDAEPEASIAAYTDRPGLIVLRSVGKFFGLAGARVGFVCAEPSLLQAIRERLGPWAVSGPSRYMVAAALADRDWQAQARPRLAAAAADLRQLLAGYGLVTEGCSLFRWCRCANAEALHHGLAQRGILTRYFAQPRSIRFGLPPDAVASRRLAQALAELTQERVGEC